MTRKVFFFALAAGLATISGLAAPMPRTRALNGYDDKHDIGIPRPASHPGDCPLMKRGDNDPQATPLAVQEPETAEGLRRKQDDAVQSRQAAEHLEAKQVASEKRAQARRAILQDPVLGRQMRLKMAAQRQSQRDRATLSPGKIESIRAANTQCQRNRRKRLAQSRIVVSPGDLSTPLVAACELPVIDPKQPIRRQRSCRRPKPAKQLAEAKSLDTDPAGQSTQLVASSAGQLHQVSPASSRPRVEHLDAEHGSLQLQALFPPVQAAVAHHLGDLGTPPSVPRAPVWRDIPAFRPVDADQAGAHSSQIHVWGGPCLRFSNYRNP
jgi:hypothetical protein